MRLNLLYVHHEGIGYGRYGLKLGETLQQLGVTVANQIDPPDVKSHERWDDMPEERCNVVCWVSTPTHAKGWWDGQIPVMSTMWEATRLPESFRESLHYFDTIIVPSWQNVELFSRYHKNVKFVPLGVDPREWFYVPRTPPERTFRFLIAGSGKRKGTDLAYKAFKKVFPDGSWGDGPTPVLVMKNPKGEAFYGDRIEVIGGKLPPEDEQLVYATAHCYLQPSRGEGFGLQPLQAMAQGMPTILTQAHGHESFAHYGYGLSTTFEKADYFIYGDSGDWWLPNLDELCDYMRYVYDNYDAACERGRFAAQAVAAEWKWTDTANKFLDAIGRDRLTGYSGSGEWIVPEIKRWPVRVHRRHAAEVGGYHYQWEPGKTYYEVADVKRLLFERGVLTADCVDGDDDTGLTLGQLDQVPEYSARQGYCRECGQRLNSTSTLSDDIFARMMENA